MLLALKNEYRTRRKVVYYFKYVTKRVLLMLFTFSIIVTMCFVLVKLLPNKPDIAFGKDQALIEQRREMLGYNKPIPVQFARFIKYAFKGNFGVGETYKQGTDVWNIFVQRLPRTVVLNVVTMLVAIPLGLMLGIVAALKKNKWQDQLISVGVMVFVSVPSFIYAFLVKYLFCFQLKWFPATSDLSNGVMSWTFIWSIMPAVISMALGTIAGFARFTRAELTEVLTSDYMLLARTKGLTKSQATVRHAMRNAMVPIFPMILGEFLSIMSGSLIIEQLFTIPGVGELYIGSVQAQPSPDYNFFMLLTVFYTFLSLAASIVIDLSYGIIDPRIRMGAK